MNPRRLVVRAASAALLVAVAFAPPARAAGSEGPPAASSPARNYFTDVELIDQNGRPQRLYSDLLEGRVVVISAMFTECPGACPAMAGTLERVQEWAGDRLGKEIHLLSITVDPTDTPEKMKAFAERFHAKPGWYFLTGSKENWELALRKLGLFTDTRESHATIFLIGNERTGLWKKALGIAKVGEILKIVEGVTKDQGESPAQGEG